MVKIRQGILWTFVFATLTAPPWRASDFSIASQRHQLNADIIAGAIRVKPVFPGATHMPVSIKCDGLGNYYILNQKDHSIVVYDRHRQFVQRIGHIGNGPGEFLDPMDLGLDQNGRLYVADRSNNRIQVLDAHGVYLRQIGFPLPMSVAVLKNGEILVVGEHDDQLIRVYSPEGRFLRTIGTPVDVGVRNPRLNAYLNRGRIIVDQEDNIYYLFRGLLDPTIRKYSPDGKLLLEIHPWGKTMTRVVSRARAKLQENIMEGRIGRASTLNALRIDPRTGNIWIAPSGPVLYVYSAHGRKLAEYRLYDDSGRMHGAIDFTLIGERGCFVNPAGCFLFDLPEIR